MTAIDRDAIRARANAIQEAQNEYGEDSWQKEYAIEMSANDVPVLLAEIDRLRPEPIEDERAVRWVDDEKALASALEAWTGAWVDRRPSLLELILAAGFSRRPLPTEAEIAQVIREYVVGADAQADSEVIASAILALLKGTDHD